MANETTTSDSAQFQPNLASKHSVVLDHPFSEVFGVLGTGEDVKALERMVRISPLCTDFTILHRDTVALPASTPLLRTIVCTLPAYDPDKDVQSEEGDMALFPRQYFQFEETVKILFGFVTTKVIVDACLTWDEGNHAWLYESFVKKSGIKIRKTREFEELDEGKDEGKKTRVTEVVEGRCSWLVKPIVQLELARAHR
jgi:hypothetical protein